MWDQGRESRVNWSLDRAVLGVVILLFGLPILACAAADDVSAADDAYHYRYWLNGQHDGNYIEWWYFNFYDSQQNAQGIFSYFITDPQNLTGFGQSQVAAVAYTANGVVSEVDAYPATAFSASYSQADVQIDNNSIQAINPDTYRVAGQSRDGRLKWDLQYVRQKDPWFAADRIAVGTLPWESMSWLIYMPRAMIAGQIVIDGRAYTINAPGYHDHNWGEWIFSNAMWNWAQYSEPGFVFDLGDFIGGSTGLASIDFQGVRTVFAKNQYQLAHVKWAFDSQNQKWYPVETVFSAQNDKVAMIVTMRAIATDPLRAPLPFPLPDVLIYEQTAGYDGIVWKKADGGQPAVPFVFHGNGFKEYTAKTRSNP